MQPDSVEFNKVLHGVSSMVSSIYGSFTVKQRRTDCYTEVYNAAEVNTCSPLPIITVFIKLNDSCVALSLRCLFLVC